MPIQNCLFKKEININNKISIRIPTVGDVVDNEDKYYSMVFTLTAMPIDLMVPLDDAGIDFSTINEYELFLILFEELKKEDTSLIFVDLDLSKFQIDINPENGNVILKDKENDIIIDRAIHGQIASTLRKINHFEKNHRKPANEEARKYLIKRAREKMKRRKNVAESQIEPLIVAMVNTEQYKYDFERTRELSIYQFNECVQQIIKKVDYDNRMYGVYAGTVSVKDLSQDDLNWLTHK